jgi:hypothetical protein
MPQLSGVTSEQAENSDVLFEGSVAVATTALPSVTPKGSDALIAALPLPSVVTLEKPIRVVPSPFPEPSQAALEKNSIRNVLFAVLLSVPRICVVTPTD